MFLGEFNLFLLRKTLKTILMIYFNFDTLSWCLID